MSRNEVGKSRREDISREGRICEYVHWLCDRKQHGMDKRLREDWWRWGQENKVVPDVSGARDSYIDH